MPHPSHSFYASAWLVGLASLGAAGCLCPPCPGTAVAVGPEAAAGANVAGPVAVGSKLMIWDGDDVGTGAQPWESCEPKPNCEAKASAEPGAGTNGSVALKFHAKGSGFLGMGWNIFGWYPPNAGVDLTPYNHLTFQIRAEAKSSGPVPDPGFTTVLLGCSANNFNTASVPVEKYAKGFADGKWHKVSIPLSAFTKGEGAKFDPHSFWEFRLGTWAGTTRSFDIYIDDIAAEKL
jgi:hypothetical protein